jgi:hypothetical protein
MQQWSELEYFISRSPIVGDLLLIITTVEVLTSVNSVEVKQVLQLVNFLHLQTT